MNFKTDSDVLLQIEDSVTSDHETISSMVVFSKDTHIYVPSSRYYVSLKDKCYKENFSKPVGGYKINWKIIKGSGVEFSASK